MPDAKQLRKPWRLSGSQPFPTGHPLSRAIFPNAFLRVSETWGFARAFLTDTVAYAHFTQFSRIVHTLRYCGSYIKTKWELRVGQLVIIKWRMKCCNWWDYKISWEHKREAPWNLDPWGQGWPRYRLAKIHSPWNMRLGGSRVISQENGRPGRRDGAPGRGDCTWKGLVREGSERGGSKELDRAPARPQDAKRWVRARAQREEQPHHERPWTPY